MSSSPRRPGQRFSSSRPRICWPSRWCVPRGRRITAVCRDVMARATSHGVVLCMLVPPVVAPAPVTVPRASASVRPFPHLARRPLRHPRSSELPPPPRRSLPLSLSPSLSRSLPPPLSLSLSLTLPPCSKPLHHRPHLDGQASGAARPSVRGRPPNRRCLRARHACRSRSR